MIFLQTKAGTWGVGGESQIKPAQQVKSFGITSQGTISSPDKDSSVSLQDTSASELHHPTTLPTPSQHSSPKAEITEKLKRLKTQLAKIQEDNNNLLEVLQVPNELKEELFSGVKRALVN